MYAPTRARLLDPSGRRFLALPGVPVRLPSVVLRVLEVAIADAAVSFSRLGYAVAAAEPTRRAPPAHTGTVVRAVVAILTWLADRVVVARRAIRRLTPATFGPTDGDSSTAKVAFRAKCRHLEACGATLPNPDRNSVHSARRVAVESVKTEFEIPCAVDRACTLDNDLCSAHRYEIVIRALEPEVLPPVAKSELPGVFAVLVWSRNLSRASCAARSSTLMEFRPRAGCYFPRVPRWPVPATPDQNRSWHTTLSRPGTKISSHLPGLSQNHAVFSCPSICPSKLSVKMSRHSIAASW